MRNGVIHNFLAHAGGLDEMGIILFPVFVGVEVWILTRGGPTPPDKKPPRPPTDRESKPRTWN